MSEMSLVAFWLACTCTGKELRPSRYLCNTSSPAQSRNAMKHMMVIDLRVSKVLSSLFLTEIDAIAVFNSASALKNKSLEVFRVKSTQLKRRW
jgi:hypothetical protein